MASPIYLDHQATTPLDSRVLAAMMPYLTEHFGNPHSTSHRFGWTADAAVDVARQSIAQLIGADAADIIFTSGATEANNLAIKGVMAASKRRHLITVATEHKCVLEAARHAGRTGCHLTVLPVQSDGRVNVNAVADALTDDTALISVMLVNNEIGVIQPLSDIAALAHAKGAVLHCDAAQGFGKCPIDVTALGVDLMSISGHKIYGPKGVGALFVRGGAGAIPMVAQMDGGGQERGLRSGTLSPALCTGLGKAAAIAAKDMDKDSRLAETLWHRLVEGLQTVVPAMVINGSVAHRLFHNLNISIPKVDGAKLLLDLRSIAVSSGAACASAVAEPSYVLKAIGVPEHLAQSSLRIGTGRMTTADEIDQAISAIAAAISRQNIAA